MRIFDALYGEVDFDETVSDLLRTPALQRLRDIRLSNIDSIGMPGIANISRYEHALGTAALAEKIGFRPHLPLEEAVVLQAAAALHDAGISAYGHLAEEALQYSSAPFDHEAKLGWLLQQPAKNELGGIEMQVYAGRESGVRRWAERAFGANAEEKLREILLASKGRGRFGRCVAGQLDLDNLDNVTRVAWHMGLDVDRALPIQIAASIVDVEEYQGCIFDDETSESIERWLALRRRVYERLMLNRDDFAGKVMLVYSIAAAFSAGDLGDSSSAWTMTDRELIGALLGSREAEVKRTIKSWLVRELWPMSDLMWMEGKAPEYSALPGFNETVSRNLQRPCFAYRIADKRTREVRLRLRSGTELVRGRTPEVWLLGLGSRKRQEFTIAETRRLKGLAEEYFGTKCRGNAELVEPPDPGLF